MARFMSVIIPNRNGAATIERCLGAVFSSRYEPFEVIVVDDASEDGSVGIISRFPCRLIRLETHAGASRARNVGAANSGGDTLFFTDADCLLQEDTLARAGKTLAAEGPDAVVGGTYTALPHDRGFFSVFQSVFVNHFETKHGDRPEYIAGHAMVIDARTFRATTGFAEEFLPILEDVEFSHRVRRAGFRLVMDPEVQVQHIFNFSLLGSLRNALRKTRYWTVYSLGHGDVLTDSGTASTELKISVGAHALSALVLLLALLTGQSFLLPFIPCIVAFNLFSNRGLIGAFHRAAGPAFAAAATAYYVLVYPVAVAAGALAGAVRYLVIGAGPRGTP
jgi:GT2 family glycosyltransferase